MIMKRLLLSGLVGVALLPGMSNAAPTTFINNGFYDFVNNGATVTPPIDAVTFINNGTFIANTILPFETANTLNFTNNGTMTSGIGWLFDDSPARVGQRRSAVNFFNGNLGTINTSVFLTIWATTIVNSGQFSLGPLGRLDLLGSSLNLRQSVMSVTSVSDEAGGSTYGTPGTNTFDPDIAIYDVYWVQTNFSQTYTLNTATIWNSNGVATTLGVPSPPAMPTAIPGFSIGGTNLVANSYSTDISFDPVTLTNSTGGSGDTLNLVTNLNKGAVFVLVPSFFKVQTWFEPGMSNFDGIDVLLSMQVTNAIDQALSTNYLFFQDNLASAPGTGLLKNSSTGNTFRPTNYFLDRLSHSAVFASNAPGVIAGLGKPEPNFFIDSGNIFVYPSDITLDLVSNLVVSGGSFAAYSAFIDNVAARPPPVAGGNITNLPGTLRINATDLDLTQARLRAEGQVVIRAVNLISSTNTLVDCENLSYDLGSKNGFLKIQNLAGTSVSRLRGTLRAWSATWSNSVTLVMPNNYVTNTTAGGFTLQPLTNTALVGYDVLVLDASALTNSLPVTEYDLLLHGTRIELDDDMTVLQSLFIDGRTFTVNGSITIPGVFPPANPINNVLFPGVPLKQWLGTNAPGVLFFTNNGTVSISGAAHFGDDRPPFTSFVNAGFLSGAGIQLRSVYFENDGVMFASSGPMILQAGSSRLQNGFGSSAGYAQITAGTLIITNYQLASGDMFNLTVTNMLSDGGTGAGNSIQVQNGFNLFIKPQTGDLLGTTIQSGAPRTTGETVKHLWAGEDRGPTPAGYLNNAAIGQLTLVSNSAAVFEFTGTSTKLGVTNAMYVDLLDVSSFGQGLGLHQLRIDPNMIIYYAAVKVSPTNIFFPNPNGLVMQPEEYLDGYQTQPGGGHLRWVRDYAGANSSTTVQINSNGVTQTGSINSALRNSQIIDSDGNGVTNATETSFKVAPVTVQITGNGTVAPNYGGQGLLVGETYKMTAQSAAGAKFLGWTGDMTSSPPALTFTVPAAGLHLVANFSYPTAASYSGLFYESNGVEFLKSGAIGLTTTAKGGYTGTLKTGARNYSFSGHLDSNGADTNSAGTYTVQLQLSDDQITGTVSSNAVWSADFALNRAVFNGTTSRAPYAGKYTILLPGSGDPTDTQNPQGDGYGFVTVNASGTLQFSGALADGTPMSLSAKVSKDGLWPLFFRLPNGIGQVLGWQSFANIGNVSGLFSWIKQPATNANRYPLGFNFQNNSLGSSYDPALAPVTGFTQNGLVLQGANLYAPIISTVTLTAANMVTKTTGNNRLSLTLTPPRGLFRGSVFDVNSGKTINFSGAILQNLGFGSGFFLNTNLCGQVYFGP